MIHMTPDMINGIFEIFGAHFIGLSIFKLMKDKMVRGVSWVHVSFFAAWGLWNLFYYPMIDQWWSFYGGVALVATNVVYVALLTYYIRKETRGWSHSQVVVYSDGTRCTLQHGRKSDARTDIQSA